ASGAVRLDLAEAGRGNRGRETCRIEQSTGTWTETLEETATIRRPFRAPPPTKEGPRVNDEIRVREVQLIDHEGENRGIVPTEEALAIAQDVGLDLVEISPNQNPPVCKILDYGRHKYVAQKKAAEA